MPEVQVLASTGSQILERFTDRDFRAEVLIKCMQIFESVFVSARVVEWSLRGHWFGLQTQVQFVAMGTRHKVLGSTLQTTT